MRLHGIDENNAGEVAELLAYFRALQRQLELSVVLVHHTRKNAAPGAAAGQALRGSSDIHAFGDSNLYLRRTKDRLVLQSEHRAAPASPPVHLELVAADAETTHLEIVAAPQDGCRRGLEERVLELLAGGQVLSRASLRDSLAVKNERLGDGAGVAGTCRPAGPHGGGLATHRPSQRRGAFPFPPERKRERNGREPRAVSFGEEEHHARRRFRPGSQGDHDGAGSRPARVCAHESIGRAMVRTMPVARSAVRTVAARSR